jgi:hypothetical protein
MEKGHHDVFVGACAGVGEVEHHESGSDHGRSPEKTGF